MTTLNLNQQRFENGNITETANWIDSLSTSKQHKIDSIKKAIRENRLVCNRCADLSSEGIETKKAPMGSGGVGQIKIMATGEIRIQIGYATGKHNYAQVAVL